MPTDNQDPGPLIRRRSTGEVRTDIEVTSGPQQPVRYDPPPREPIRVVGRPRPLQVPEPRRSGRDQPGRATAITYTTASYVHQFRVVLPRYLVAGLILGGLALVFTKTIWLAAAAACLPLPVFVWWVLVVRKQAKAYARGEAPPPPGWFGKL